MSTTPQGPCQPGIVYRGKRQGQPSVRVRCKSRKAHRLDNRRGAHQEFPVAADGSEYTKTKPKAIEPGSCNPRKH